jgi:1-hydroxycarotenoid 3,4-desaturase
MAEAHSAHRAVVIGAGIGGLVSALLLASRGVQVTLLEAAAAPGGKMRQVAVNGAAIDSGPTVFTMRWVFEQILEAAGGSLADLPALTPLNVLARHAWRGHDKRLDLYANREQSAQAIAEFSSPAEAQRFLAFCKQAQQVYQALEGPYIRGPRPMLTSFPSKLGLRGLAALAGLGPFAKLWNSLGRHFHDPKLRQLFARYATYTGSSPWESPATLMLVAQVELDGVWSVQGGMHAVAHSFAKLAEKRGATLRYGAACERIVVRNGRVRGVVLAGGEEIAADSVVFNGNPQALVDGLLGQHVTHAVPPLPIARRSLSAVTWSAHTPTAGFPLARHNVFFEDDYRREFDDIFKQRRLPRAGTVYVCAQDRADNTAWPEGAAERLLCLVNAPADGDGRSTAGGASRSFDVQEIQACEQHSLALLRGCGLQISLSPQHAQLTTPADFHRLFPASGGALYGQATHGWMSSFQRPGSLCRVPGLYLAGGGVHPGPGVPMAALSGQRAAETLLAHLDSTSRSRLAPISGGTSTPSATTAATH